MKVGQIPPNEDAGEAVRVVFVTEASDSIELTHIIAKELPAWAELFARKNGEYQDGAGAVFTLGARGQFSDMHRKMIKLKAALWDGNEDQLTSESVDEILRDLIGHAFLTLVMRSMDRERGTS